MTGTRIRLYESALNDVRYVYGHPVRWSRSAELLPSREARKEALIKAEEERLRREVSHV